MQPRQPRPRGGAAGSRGASLLLPASVSRKFAATKEGGKKGKEEKKKKKRMEEKRSSAWYPAIHSRLRAHFALRDETLRCAASVRYIGHGITIFVFAIDTGDKRRITREKGTGEEGERERKETNERAGSAMRRAGRRLVARDCELELWH